MIAKTQDDITRDFWALFLDAKVAKGGQIVGFRKAWDAMTPWAQEQADRYCRWTWRKIQRGRDAEECIAAGVAVLRDQLRLYAPPSSTAHAGYSAFRFELMARILDNSLKPIEVAKILEDAADRFPEITHAECIRYREMGDVWQPWSGPQLSPERCEQIRQERGQKPTPSINRPRLRLTDEEFFARQQAPLGRIVTPSTEGPAQ